MLQETTEGNLVISWVWILSNVLEWPLPFLQRIWITVSLVVTSG